MVIVVSEDCLGWVCKSTALCTDERANLIVDKEGSATFTTGHWSSAVPGSVVTWWQRPRKLCSMSMSSAQDPSSNIQILFPSGCQTYHTPMCVQGLSYVCDSPLQSRPLGTSSSHPLVLNCHIYRPI